ncbi:MAG: polymerase [Actinomycetota bacterium]|jgi:DNA polymerase-1|nr:polymerase [Actinomycetota bacterium]
MLLDGNSMAYRAFFALPTDLATASGQVTNAVYGFTSMLINLFKDHHPDGIAVAFDRPERTFRHDLVDDYKAGRAAAPDILRQQMGLVRQVVETLKIPIVEIAGFEADDVIATLATQGRDRGDDVIVVTGDRDAYQLVEDPHVKVLYNRRGVSDYVLYDEAGILERTGVTPPMYPQYAALRGDPSDNLPGVPGVGEKTAAKLLNTYGDLDGVFANVDKCTPKLRENLIAHEPVVRRNATATPLVRDVDLGVDLSDLRMGEFDATAVRELFNFLEFNTLHPRLMEAIGTAEAVTAAAAAKVDAEPLAVDVRRATTVDDAVAALGAPGPVSLAVHWSGVEGRSQPDGIAVAADGSDALAVWIPAELLASPPVAAVLVDVPFRAHNAKTLLRGLGLDLRGLDIDTAIAAYLIDPAESQYLLDDLATRFLGVEVRSPDAPPPGQLDLSGTTPDPAEEAGRRAVAVGLLVPALAASMDARGLRRLYDEVERPLVRVLARMEAAGVRVDVELLRSIYDGLVAEGARLEEEIQELAGERFLVNSTLQLRRVLFDQLGLQPQKKTKTGFSTDAASLEKLRGLHPIIEPLLRYREVEKLRSTYGESLLAEVGPDGRIHATFNQTVARTGRLSSDRPNLHNIPIRTEEGRRIRQAFLPTEGCRFLVADYNQIELRVIAHLAQDPGLIEAFATGQDIHKATAARLFSVDPEEVTLGQRSKAKMVSYGLAYGMESFGLGQRLGIPTEEAALILGAYFEAFPSVRAYMERTVVEARDRGYTETLFGRRRQIPELQSQNYRLRQAGERQAMNAGIQGLAADIFKVALVRLDRALEQLGLASRLVLQVHDEVILEVPPSEEEGAAAITLEAMRGAAELSVPLEVNLAWGDSWATAKG